MDNLARALNHTTMWHDWMMSDCTSYARRCQEIKPYSLPSAIMAARHEFSDILALQDQVERDAVDGAIDDPALKSRYKKEIKEALSSHVRVLESID